MNYYERHLGDYAKDTAHLSMLEHGAYGLLLDRYYGTEQGIPADQVHRIARARTREEREAVDIVLAEFFQLVDGVWTNKRAEEEIEKAQAKIKAAQENGKRGGRPKRNPSETQQKPGGFSVGSENETQQKAHQSPDTRHQTPVGKQPSSLTETLEGATGADGDDLPDPPRREADWLSWFNRHYSTGYSAVSRFDRKNLWPIFQRWCSMGITQAQMRAAIERAYATAKEPIGSLPSYVDRVIATMQAPPTQADASKLAAARAIFGTEIEGNGHGAGNIIDVTPTARALGG